MTILLTESLGSFTSPMAELATEFKEHAKGQPITTLYKIRTDTRYRLFMKTGKNNFICMEEKIMYRLKHMGKRGLRLIKASNSDIEAGVHDFVVQIAFLKLR